MYLENYKNCQCPNGPIICSSCYYDLPIQMEHDCTSWDLQLTKKENIVLNPSIFMEVYKTYVMKHEYSVQFGVLLFENTFIKFVQRKIENLEHSTADC